MRVRNENVSWHLTRISHAVPTLIEDDPGCVGAELGEEKPDRQAQAPHADLQLLHRSPLLVADTVCFLALGLEGN